MYLSIGYIKLTALTERVVMVCYNPSLDDKMSVIPYTTRVDAHFLHNNMDYAITATFDFICRMSPREKIRASIFSPTA